MIPAGYTLLEDGTIIGKRGKALAPVLNPNGRLQFTVWVGGKQRTFQVHKVICEAFHGPKPFPGAQVRHLDGNQLNNAASNLCWGTHAENMADRGQHGTTAKGEQDGASKLTEQQVLEIRSRYATGGDLLRELAAEYGVSKSAISMVINRLTWGHVDPVPEEAAGAQRKLEAAVRRDTETREMVAMRDAGATWQAIGDRFGLTLQGARYRVLMARQAA